MWYSKNRKLGSYVSGYFRRRSIEIFHELDLLYAESTLLIYRIRVTSNPHESYVHTVWCEFTISFTRLFHFFMRIAPFLPIVHFLTKISIMYFASIQKIFLTDILCKSLSQIWKKYQIMFTFTFYLFFNQ